MSLRRAVATVGVAVLAAFSGSSALAFNQVVVFGDSLSDTGNLARKFGGAVPAAPYANGRFSNGAVAVETLARQLDVPLVNAAIGGALTGTDNQFAKDNPLVADTGMMSQVRQYVADPSGISKQVEADALFVLWGGGNDFLAVIHSGSAAGIGKVINAAVNNLVTEAGLLYDAGARHLLVPLLPDLGTTFYGTSGAISPVLLSGLTELFNESLRSGLQSLAAGSPGLDLTVFDTPTFLAGVRQGIADAGGDITGRCWDGDYTGANNTHPVCADPSKVYLFDKVHPNADVHARVGQAMAMAVVPEPSTSGMMLVGLLMGGLMLRKRRVM